MCGALAKRCFSRSREGRERSGSSVRVAGEGREGGEEERKTEWDGRAGLSGQGAKKPALILRNNDVLIV